MKLMQKWKKRKLAAFRCCFIIIEMKNDPIQAVIGEQNTKKMKIHTEKQHKMNFPAITYNVLDAKFVSSCFNWPSSARPHLSLLFAKRGVNVKTFESVKPGWTWQPSLRLSKAQRKKKFSCKFDYLDLFSSFFARVRLDEIMFERFFRHRCRSKLKNNKKI